MQTEEVRQRKKEWNRRNRERLKLQQAEWRALNPGYSAAKSKEWHKQNPQANKAYWLKRQYNMTLEHYNKLLELQNHCCGICKLHKSSFSKDLFVDHCHTTGRIRGLLCDKCNRGLGLFNDNPTTLNEAAKYLIDTKGGC